MTYSQPSSTSPNTMNETLRRSSKIIATLTMLAGVGAVAIGLMHWTDINWLRLSAFTAIGIVAAMLKVKLPGMNSSMSVNLPFILLATTEMSIPGVLIIACMSALVQSLWHSQVQVKAVQIAFNLSTIAVAAEAAWFIFHNPPQAGLPAVAAIYVSLAAAGYLLVNTLLVGIMVASVQQSGFGKVWTNILTLTFPYYVLSAGLAVTAISISRYAGWPALLVLLAVMFGVYSSYNLYFGGKKPHSAETQPNRVMSAAAANG
jgi:hypothetical protein